MNAGFGRQQATLLLDRYVLGQECYLILTMDTALNKAGEYID